MDATMSLLVSTALLGLLVSLAAGQCRNFDPLTQFENCVRKSFITQDRCQTDVDEQALCVRNLNQNCFNNSEISELLNEQRFRDAAKYACDNFNDVKPDLTCFGNSIQKFWECFYASGDTTNRSPDNVCLLIPKLLDCSAKHTGKCSTGYNTYERQMFPSQCGGVPAVQCQDVDPITLFENCVRKTFITQDNCIVDMETRALCVRNLNQNCFNSEISELLNEQRFREAAKYACDNFNDVKPDRMCFQNSVQKFWECFYTSGDTTNKSPDNVCSLITRMLDCSAKHTGKCSTGYNAYERRMFPSQCVGDVIINAGVAFSLHTTVAILSSFTYFILSA